jgi:hypothetical protein
MFDSVVDKLAARVDQRFLTGLLLPCILFSLSIGALAAADLGFERSVAWWSTLAGPRQAMVVAVAAAGLLVATSFVGVMLPLLVRLYEGYWGAGPLGRMCVLLGVYFEERRRQRLLRRTDGGADARRYYTLPRPGVPLLPTRFGNVLRAAESYASDPERYGMDSVFFWPRLFSVLPKQLRTSLSAARADMEQMIVASALALLAAAFAILFGLIRNLPVAIWLSAAVAGALISRTAYNIAVRSAIAFGDLVRTAFDLHRRPLLQAMGLSLPETLPEERAMWKALGQQLFRRIADEPDLLRYQQAATTDKGALSAALRNARADDTSRNHA